MKRTILILALLAAAAVVAPAIAYAQELIPTPDMVAPLGLVTFGFLGLIGGVVGYIRRHHPTR